jgi:hypothetical protein
MNNPFDETRAAVKAAREQLNAADAIAYSMANLLRGRLRKVDDRYTLAELKRELQDFNAVTGKWKGQQ